MYNWYDERQIFKTQLQKSYESKKRKLLKMRKKTEYDENLFISELNNLSLNQIEELYDNLSEKLDEHTKSNHFAFNDFAKFWTICKIFDKPSLGFNHYQALSFLTPSTQKYIHMLKDTLKNERYVYCGFELSYIYLKNHLISKVISNLNKESNQSLINIAIDYLNLL